MSPQEAGVTTRSHEVDRLVALVARARAGRAAVGVVSGPEGVGKSWLLDHLVTRVSADDDSAVILRAGGHRAERELPYAALHQLLLPVIDGLDALAVPQRSALRGALAMSDFTPRDSFAAASGLLQLVTLFAERRPVAIVVDDVEWLDQSSQQALLFMTRRLGADRVAVIFAGRDLTDVGAAAPVEHISLEPLGEHDARAVVRVVRPEVSASTLDAIVTAAAGLPLALREIPCELTQAQLRGEEPLPTPLPIGPRLGQLYAGRLRSLDDHALLALVAVSLEPLDQATLVQVFARLEVPIGALDAADALGLVRIDGFGARVAHPTIAAAVQALVTVGTRHRVHEVMAQVLLDQPARRAWHLDAVTVGPDDAVAEAFGAAAADAEARSAWLMAGRAHHAASKRSTASDRARDHLERAAVAFARAGASASLVEMLTRLASATDDPNDRLAIETELVAARIWSPTSEIDVDAVHATAVRWAGVAPIPAARLQTTLALGLVISGHPERARTQLDAARSLIRIEQADAEMRLAWDVIDLQLGGRGGGELDGPWAEALTDAQLAAPSLPIISAASALIWGGWSARARELLERQCAVLESIGAVGHLGVYHGMLANSLALEGEWLAARMHYATGIALCGDTDLRGPLPHIQMRSAYLHAALGDRDACETLMTEARVGSSGSPMVAHMEACVFGLLAVGEGRCAEAIELLGRAGDWERDVGLLNPGYSSRAGDLADALWRLQRTDELAGLAVDFGRRAERAARPGPLAVAARMRALQATTADIDAAFDEALAWHDQTGDVFERARTELSWGRRLRRVRRKRDARPHLRAAVDCFERLGAVPWADQARSELVACGERRAVARIRGAELTPRELDVAMVVARGASNPEAAAELFISRRTVEDHLRSVYRKLDIRDRTELGDALMAPGTSG